MMGSRIHPTGVLSADIQQTLAQIGGSVAAMKYLEEATDGMLDYDTRMLIWRMGE